MTDDDLRTRAREAAVKYSPAHISEYMGYWKGYMAGFRAHAAQQPSREQIARALFIASDPGSADQMALAWDAPGDGGRQRWWNYADAVLALFDGAGS